MRDLDRELNDRNFDHLAWLYWRHVVGRSTQKVATHPENQLYRLILDRAKAEQKRLFPLFFG